MPYRPQHREQVRERIIQSARKLFNDRGFVGVSIDDVMASAGLTRGSFYSYFQSKSDLYSEMIDRFVSEVRADGDFTAGSRGRASRILRDHLSRENKGEINCPLVALYSDLSQADRTVKGAFETALKLMIDTFEQGMTPGAQSARHRAMALVSLCVGGKVLADWIQDRALADELQDATKAIAIRLF
jgi:TetR/AcrR family transcriptional repressor of nem operon